MTLTPDTDMSFFSWNLNIREQIISLLAVCSTHLLK